MGVQKGRLTDGASLSPCFGDIIIPSDIICAKPVMYLISFISVSSTPISSDLIDLPVS